MDNDSHLLVNDWNLVDAKGIENLINKKSKDSEGNEETDDSRGCIAEEAEIVADYKLEDYKEEFTGIKVKYNLTRDEVKAFISRCKEHGEYKKIQKKHIIIQGILFLILSIMACLGKSPYYLVMSAIPLFSIILMWAIPFINLRVNTRNLVNENEFTVDIFPDRLEIESKSGSRVIYLNNTCQSEEHKDMIMIFKSNEPGLVIPLRCIDPDFRADVQAIIVAGSSPTNKQFQTNS